MYWLFFVKIILASIFPNKRLAGKSENFVSVLHHLVSQPYPNSNIFKIKLFYKYITESEFKLSLKHWYTFSNEVNEGAGDFINICSLLQILPFFTMQLKEDSSHQNTKIFNHTLYFFEPIFKNAVLKKQALLENKPDVAVNEFFISPVDCFESDKIYQNQMLPIEKKQGNFSAYIEHNHQKNKNFAGNSYQNSLAHSMPIFISNSYNQIQKQPTFCSNHSDINPSYLNPNLINSFNSNTNKYFSYPYPNHTTIFLNAANSNNKVFFNLSPGYICSNPLHLVNSKKPVSSYTQVVTNPAIPEPFYINYSHSKRN